MEEEKQYFTIILRHDTSTQWMVNDPILSLGEYGVEDDTHKVKRGDGESKWSELPYEDFGLLYIVTFENLNGEVADNAKLNEALNLKISSSVFADVGNTVITGIQLTNGEDGTIARILKTNKNISTGTTTLSNVYIQSTDNSIQGMWSVDETGAQILNLSAESTIMDYEKNHTYYKNQICFYNNKLYRAISKFTATTDFNPSQWVQVASLHSDDILYDNMVSGLDATTVKEAIDELKRRADNKLNISTEQNIVYGTTINGEQTVIPINDLRKVDTVNRISADTSKNIQLDANSINYNDASPELGTVRDVLDSKVDKIIAGKGAKIVRDIAMNYNEEDGTLTFTLDKVSLEDGTADKPSQSINIVSEKELQQAIDSVTESITRLIDETKLEIDAELTQELDTKVDKDIADNLITDISVINEEEPTIRITRANTSSKAVLINNIHFKSNGNIQTKYEADDHIVIDSSVIDTSIEQINTTLGDIDTKLKNNEKEIASLQEHDVNHESTLATHTQQIASLETKNIEITTQLTNLNMDITDVKNVNASQEIHLTSIDATLERQTEQIQENADLIVEINKNISDDSAIIKELQTNSVMYNEERNIDVENNIALKKNMMLTGATTTQHYNLASMKTYNEGLENEQIQAEYGTINVHTQIFSKDRPIIELPDSIKHDIAYKDELDTINSNLTEQIETANNEIANLELNKLDKSFTETLVNKTNYVAPDGLELLKIQTTNILTANNETSIDEFTFKSSDNTIIAKPIMQEDKLIGIDLATNLDTDVNYFVTSETLNTTIANDNTIQLDSLTATDKQNLEVQDIISDADGTWARVKSIDTEGGTCIAVTFAKHAQAVWGTIKGTIDDQLDLKEILDSKLDWNRASNLVSWIKFSDTGTDKNDLEHINASFDYIQTNPSLSGATNNIMEIAKSESIKISKGTGTNPTTYRFNVDAEGVDFDPLDTGIVSVKISPAIRELKGLININTENISNLTNNKLDKVSTANIVYGTNASGEQTQIDVNSIGKIDKVNNIAPVDKNVTLTANDINLATAIGDTPQDTSIQEMLVTISNTLTNMKNDLINQIKEYKSNTQYNKNGTFTVQNYVTITRDDGVMLMAKVNTDFTSSSAEETEYDNFALDVTNGNLVLVGIPEQVGNNTVETTNDEI